MICAVIVMCVHMFSSNLGSGVLRDRLSLGEALVKSLLSLWPPHPQAKVQVTLGPPRLSMKNGSTPYIPPICLTLSYAKTKQKTRGCFKFHSDVKINFAWKKGYPIPWHAFVFTTLFTILKSLEWGVRLMPSWDKWEVQLSRCSPKIPWQYPMSIQLK